MDRDELCRAAGRGRWRRWWPETQDLGQRPPITTIAGRLERVSPLRAGMREGSCPPIRSGSCRRAGREAPMSITRSWRWPRSTSCATAVKLEPRPDPDPWPNKRARSPRPPPRCPPAHHRLPHEAALFDDPEIQRRTDRRLEGRPRHRWHQASGRRRCPPPSTWFLRPHRSRLGRRPPPYAGAHTTVVVHLDIERHAALHLGLLTDAERRYLGCDATCGLVRTPRPADPGGRSAHQPAASPPGTPPPACAIARLQGHPRSAPPSGTGRTAGPTGCNLVRSPLPPGPSRGLITITGPRRSPSHRHRGAPTQHPIPGRPPSIWTPRRALRGPTGERADWCWWYQPFQPQPPPSGN